MKIENTKINIQTKGEYDFNDITDQISDFVKQSGIKNGLVNIQTFHTTAPLIVNENEPLLIEDLKKNLEKIASKKDTYDHDDFKVRTVNMCKGECANGHSHCKAIYLLANVTLNLINEKVQLGKWQRVFLVELDRKRERKVQMQVMGE